MLVKQYFKKRISNKLKRSPTIVDDKEDTRVKEENEFQDADSTLDRAVLVDVEEEE